MLFDLRGRRRRRAVQVIYVTLAILMGGGLVFFGIGGNTSGGLFDAFNGDGGSSSTDTFAKRAESIERQLRAHPTSTRLWADLTRARYHDANSGDGFDQNTGVFTEKGKEKLVGAARAWDRYLALEPTTPDDGVASLMVQALGPSGLNRLDDATSAAEIVAAARPKSYGLYQQLAELAYFAGQKRKADLAKAKAISLAPKDQRETIKSSLEEAEKQAASQASATTTATP